MMKQQKKADKLLEDQKNKIHKQYSNTLSKGTNFDEW